MRLLQPYENVPGKVNQNSKKNPEEKLPVALNLLKLITTSFKLLIYDLSKQLSFYDLHFCVDS